MGIFGPFVTGSITGIVGLGVVSWLIATKTGNNASDESGKE